MIVPPSGTRDLGGKNVAQSFAHTGGFLGPQGGICLWGTFPFPQEASTSIRQEPASQPSLPG